MRECKSASLQVSKLATLPGSQLVSDVQTFFILYSNITTRDSTLAILEAPVTPWGAAHTSASNTFRPFSKQKTVTALVRVQSLDLVVTLTRVVTVPYLGFETIFTFFFQ